MVHKMCVPLLGVLCVILNSAQLSQSAPFSSSSGQNDVAKGPMNFRGEIFLIVSTFQNGFLFGLSEGRQLDCVGNYVMQNQIDYSETSAPPSSSSTGQTAEQGPGNNVKVVEIGSNDSDAVATSVSNLETDKNLGVKVKEQSQSTIITVESKPEEKKPRGRVTLFPFYNRRGEWEHFVVHDSCVRLPKNWHDKVASVNTHDTCVQLCEKINCRGKCIRVQPGSPSHNRLRDIDWESRTVSLKPC